MPRGLKRYQQSKQSHFITFCCYHRRALFLSAEAKAVFEAALERVRRAYRVRVYGYVVMPEHVHLLLSEPEQATLADALKSLKQGVARRRIGDAEHFWQKRYYDHNVRSHEKFVEKLRYMHRNPVKRGLVEQPDQWRWSSFRAYAYDEPGLVRVRFQEWPVAIQRRPVATFTDGKHPLIRKVRE